MRVDEERNSWNLSSSDKHGGTYRRGEGGKDPAYASDPGSESCLWGEKEKGNARRQQN